MEKKILEEFAKYNWDNFSFYLKRNGDYVYVYFENVEFVFYFDKNYNSITCSFKKINDNYEVYLSELIDLKIIENIELYDDFSERSIDCYIKQITGIIHSFLLNIIKGDFSFFNKVKKIKQNIAVIQDRMGMDFIFETKIFNKMIRGDESWIVDLKEIPPHLDI
ncbi:hypothetical protein [Tenacibaculum maritimum]|uniref:hypothetical protein n=1 Tax=Tenacibaculum maritimum TaxID=107401 RepID=UPI00388FF168